MGGRDTTRPMMFASHDTIHRENARHRPRLRALGLALTGLALSAGGMNGAQAQAGCSTSAQAQAEAARAVAKSAAQETLSSKAALYRLMYDDIRYGVNVGKAEVNGNKARVTGSITLQGKERLSGKAMGQTFQGVVFLTKNGCNWQATGYQQS